MRQNDAIYGQEAQHERETDKKSAQRSI